MGSLITDSLEGEVRTKGLGSNFLENLLVDNHEESSQAFKNLTEEQKKTIQKLLGLEEEEIIEGDMIETQMLMMQDDAKAELVTFIKDLLDAPKQQSSSATASDQ